MESRGDIENIAYNILKESKSWGRFPTPVNDIVNYAELTLDKSVDLSKVHPNFITRKLGVLKKALNKVLGAVDIRHKTIYLDLSVNPSKQKFIKLHETGHKVIPWQKKIFEFVDDKNTLAIDTKELFEKEASFFASSALFQLDRFEEEADKLPLSLESSMILAKKFGASNHASIRRYVEYSKKRCALLVLEKYDPSTRMAVLKDYFQSNIFTMEFGRLNWPNFFGTAYPFIFDITIRRRIQLAGTFTYFMDNKNINFNYHFFNNTYNYFVFLFPFGEINKSRIKILPKF